MKLPPDLAAKVLAQADRVGPSVTLPRNHPFIKLCKDLGLPTPVPEFRFHTSRRWRFDWCWVERKIALEIQGGIWTSGRHVRGAALLDEYEKLNEAAILGYRVLFCTPEQFARGDAIVLVQRAIWMMDHGP